MKNFKNLKPIDFTDQIGFERDTFDGNNIENIDIQSSIKQSGSSIKILQNTRFVVKISECQLFSAGNSKKIDKIYFSKREI